MLADIFTDEPLKQQFFIHCLPTEFNKLVHIFNSLILVVH